jgi:phosphate starvation-inducible PhoH-like protein
MVERKIKLSGINTLALLGFNDTNLHLIEKNFDAGITVRGDNLILKGEKEEVEKVERVFKELIFILNRNGHLTENDINIIIDLVKLDSEDSAHTTHRRKKRVEDDLDSIILFTKNGPIRAKTPGQLEYYRQVKKNDIVFVIGPAGTGKTYLAVAMAVASLKNNEVNKIVLCRPAVEAGESLGFLPGDLREKIDPYLRPLYDALDDMLPSDKLKSYFDKRIIEIIPLAYMRGRTLSNAFVILDEAQNATSLQMKMFLTRLGVNSKAIITGDITQIDLPSKTTSGLVEIQDILKGIEGIAFVYLDKRDVVRHRLVKDIIEAYDKYNAMNGANQTKNKEQNNEQK